MHAEPLVPVDPRIVVERRVRSRAIGERLARVHGEVGVSDAAPHEVLGRRVRQTQRDVRFASQERDLGVALVVVSSMLG